jgi:hypothetical protein
MSRMRLSMEKYWRFSSVSVGGTFLLEFKADSYGKNGSSCGCWRGKNESAELSKELKL